MKTHYTEAELEARLRKRVRLIGGMVQKFISAGSGPPDRVILIPGGSIHLVELKTVAGRLSEIQKLWHQNAARRGVKVVVLSGPDEIDAWVAEQGRLINAARRGRRKTKETTG